MRRPIHVVYGGAHLFKAGTASKLGALARESLARFAPDDASFAEAFGLDPALAALVRPRVAAKLEREPVEDLRVDFEDGYGPRPDSEEDAHAVSAAAEMAAGMKAGTLPPFVGVRVKALSGGTRDRAARTLALFLDALLDRSGGALPAGFRVTLPKVEDAEAPEELDRLLSGVEKSRGLLAGAIRAELMVETPAAILAPDGTVPLLALVAAFGGRCDSAHLGAYDYTGACGVVSGSQGLRHPACVHARAVMQAALAGTGVGLSDSATTLLPVGEDAAAVRRARRLHFDNVTSALADGFYQGWDLHPAQLPVRYAATYAFFLTGLGDATARMRNFRERAAQATRVGASFDDAATGWGLENFFRLGRACGALTAEEAAVAALPAGQN